MVSLEKGDELDKAVPVAPIRKSYFLLRNLMNRLRAVCRQDYGEEVGRLEQDIHKIFADNAEGDHLIITARTLVDDSHLLSWVSERDAYDTVRAFPQGTSYTLSDALWALHEYEQRYHDETEGGEQYLVDGMTTLQREAMKYAEDLVEDKTFDEVWEAVQVLYNEHEDATFYCLVTLLFDVRDALRNWQFDGLKIFNTDVV